MRTVSNSLVAMLIVAALFWGNCYSCPQVLLSLSAKAPHGCCKRPAPVAKTCTTSVLKQFVKADQVQVAAPAVTEALCATPAALADPRELPAAPEAPHSPPGLLQSISVLRI